MDLSEIKEEVKRDVPMERSLIVVSHRETHKVVNKVIRPANSGYPRISPLEADLMELMGDALGG